MTVYVWTEMRAATVEVFKISAINIRNGSSRHCIVVSLRYLAVCGGIFQEKLLSSCETRRGKDMIGLDFDYCKDRGLHSRKGPLF